MKNFVIDKVDGKTTIFDVEGSVFYSFNETGSYIFSLLRKHKKKEEIINLLVKKYKISEKKARGDVDDFVKKLQKNKILSNK